MLRTINSFFALITLFAATAQSYTSYFTGNPVDSLAIPFGGTCMMGGASEFDPAMQWFLDRANGGDVLVLRASGSDGYNSYMYSDLGGVNSVETILFNNALAASDPYVAGRIQKAEAIWFAGGDQWDYVSYWRNSSVMDLVNEAIAHRHIAIGGTSAGMAILGGCYFSAENGSVTSTEALNNPFNTYMTVDCTPFLNVSFLAHTITDTHYDNPDRRGRHFTFLSRMAQQGDSVAYGIACNEYVAVCIAPDGIAHVYGEYPEYQEFAYFLQMNCVPPSAPETCEPGTPLTWDRYAMAVKVYKVPGLPGGTNWFDLNDHISGAGGVWQDWSAVAGNFTMQAGNAPLCVPTNVSGPASELASLRWNAVEGVAEVSGLSAGESLQLYTLDGRKLATTLVTGITGTNTIRLPGNFRGLFLLRKEGSRGQQVWKLARP